MENLFAEGFEYILTSKFQNDPLERSFFQYPSMSGCRFLVSLREVTITEKILGYRSILNTEKDYSLKEKIKNVMKKTK